MMEVRIRNYEKEDLSQILDLIKELARFEKAPGKVSNTVQQMEKEMAFFECFVAEDDRGGIIGMALYYFVYYTWVGKSMYLDDLIVSRQYRGNGVGTRLFEKVIEEARRQDCKRLRWQVLDWNRKAIDLYKKYYCEIDDEWLNCDLSFI